MKKWIRRLFFFLIVLIILAGLAVWGVLRYIAPQDKLDLQAHSIDIGEKVKEMALQTKLELALSEEDVNSLVKQQLIDQPQIAPDVRLMGARFELQRDQLTAHINVKYRNQIPVGAVATYRLIYEQPILIAVPQGLHIRSIRLPYDSLDELVIPLGELLPKMIEIDSVNFDPDQIRIGFKADLNLDLKELLKLP